MATHYLYATVSRLHHDESWEENGWVDLNWDSGRVIHQDRENVNALHEITDDELRENAEIDPEFPPVSVEEWLELHTGAFHDNGDGNYYGQGEYLTRHSLEGGYTDVVSLHYYREDD